MAIGPGLTPERAFVAVAGVVVIVGPEHEAEPADAIVAGLAPYRTADGGYSLQNEFHYLIARA